MTDVKIKWSMSKGSKPEDGKPVNRIYPKDAVDLFAGEQLVIVGRYKKAGRRPKSSITGKVGDKEQKFDFPGQARRAERRRVAGVHRKTVGRPPRGRDSRRDRSEGQERRIGQGTGALSPRHGILTPYTSFLADENAERRDLTSNLRSAERAVASARCATDGSNRCRAAGCQGHATKQAEHRQSRRPAP